MSPRYSHALVRPPADNFFDGVTEANLGLPDIQLALEQHANYCAALRNCGLELIILPPEQAYPDSCFVEDTAIVVDRKTVVIARPGHTTRRGEEKSVRETLSKHKTIIDIEEPGTVDGGDIMHVGDHFFIGLSKRTNREGADQLSEAIIRCGKSASTLPVEKFIHLKTFITSINADTVIGLINHIPEQLQHVKNQILVPAKEHWAANCLSANGTVILPVNCPITEASVRNLGLQVATVDVSEFQKMDGRLTCLSILF